MLAQLLYPKPNSYLVFLKSVQRDSIRYTILYPQTINQNHVSPSHKPALIGWKLKKVSTMFQKPENITKRLYGCSNNKQFILS